MAAIAMTERNLTWTTMRQAWRDIPSMSRLAAPLAAAQVGQLAINTTDVLMLGWLGPEALAATAITTALFLPVLLLLIGTVSACAPIMAQAVGRKDIRAVRRAFRQASWAGVILAVPSTVVLLQTEMILVFFGQEPELAAMGGDYMAGLVWSLLPAVLFVVVRSYVTTFERTRALLALTGLMIVMNALLNYVLIFGAFGLPALGMFGAGLGSAITGLVSITALLIYCNVRKPFRRHVILGRFWRADWQMLRRIFALGLPIGFSIVLEVSVFGASSILMGWIGTLELAAHQVAMQLASIAFMAPLGISQAATIRVGQAFGQGRILSARQAGFSAILLSMMFMALAASMFVAFPSYLIWPFLDDSGEAATVMAFAIGFLMIAAAFQVIDGLQVTAMGALRGLQDTYRPMWIAGVGYWLIGLPVAAALGFLTPLAGNGIWIGLALGLLVVSVLLTRRFSVLTLPDRSGREAIA